MLLGDAGPDPMEQDLSAEPMPPPTPQSMGCNAAGDEEWTRGELLPPWGDRKCERTPEDGLLNGNDAIVELAFECKGELLAVWPDAGEVGAGAGEVVRCMASEVGLKGLWSARTGLAGARECDGEL